MNLTWLSAMLIRDLKTLAREIQAYPLDRDVWALPYGVANSGGTLALHLVGNLEYFIGAQLGGSGYVRDREAEFSRRNVPRTDLLAGIEAAGETVGRTLARLDSGTLEQPYPIAVGKVRLRTGDFLLHLAAHLAYHLGQVDYHRRLVTGDGRTVGAGPVAELASARLDA